MSSKQKRNKDINVVYNIIFSSDKFLFTMVYPFYRMYQLFLVV